MNYIGVRIRRLMDQYGYDETEMARRAGLNQSTINRVLNSTTIPKFTTLKKIAESLNIPVEALTHPDETVSMLLIELSRLDREVTHDLLKHAEMEKLYREKKKQEKG
jgi:transcriptional regulator with XRE-family HTH domain